MRGVPQGLTNLSAKRTFSHGLFNRFVILSIFSLYNAKSTDGILSSASNIFTRSLLARLEYASVFFLYRWYRSTSNRITSSSLAVECLVAGPAIVLVEIKKEIKFLFDVIHPVAKLGALQPNYIDVKRVLLLNTYYIELFTTRSQ